MLTRRTLLATSVTTGVTAAFAPRRIEVIAHRGEHLSHAENTIPAIAAAIALGCDWVELDVRTTRDGAQVLMHDATVDRMTNGHGKVDELTLEQIRALTIQGARVPTLDQALATLRPSRCGLYLDAKQVTANAILGTLHRHRMMQRCVVYGGLPLLRELAQAGHSHLAMPEAVSVELLQKSLLELKPSVIAFDRRDFTSEILAVARAARKRIFVDRLGAEDTPEAWQDAVRRGATGIQSDRPAALIEHLRQQGHR